MRVPPPRKRALPLDRLFRTALVLVPFGVLGNLALSLATTDRDLLASLGAFPREYLFLAVGLGLVPWFTNALRLRIWTHFIGHPLSFRDAFRLTLATELASAATPTASGGGLFRWGLLVQRGVSPGAAASLVSLVVLEDTLFFLFAIPVGVVLSSAWNLPILQRVAEQIQGSALEALGIAALLGGVSWALARLVLSGRLGARARRRGVRGVVRARRRTHGAWRDARSVYELIARRGRSRFALSMTLTAVQWACRYSVVSALIAFLGAPVYPVLFFVLQWVIFTLLNFVPTPGAAGGAEAAFYLVFSAFLPGPVIGLATAGWRFLTFYLQLALGALVFMVLNAVGARERRAAEKRGNPLAS
jgi:uncharacterized protein (TIRG00374 family)